MPEGPVPLYGGAICADTQPFVAPRDGRGERKPPANPGFAREISPHKSRRLLAIPSAPFGRQRRLDEEINPRPDRGRRPLGSATSQATRAHGGSQANGKCRYGFDGDPSVPLWVLRDEIGLTGTKFGCGAALCGACTVLVDGQAIRSCTAPAW